MKNLHIEILPELRDPMFVLAFEGWNDAARSATIAARFLINQYKGKRFAWFGPDEFFQYSDQRPLVRLDRDGNRKISWPENAFYYCKHPDLSRDLVVCVGVEPQLRWKTFSQDVLELVQVCKSRLAVTMGALLAGLSHTEPPELVCLATDPSLADRTGVAATKYEGPTGIVGVIHTQFQNARIPAVSLWANIPHYISSLPNPKAAHALLDRLGATGEVRFDLSELQKSVDQFDSQIKEAIEDRPEIARLLSQTDLLNVRAEKDLDEDEEAQGTEPEELPSGEELADEIQSFFRRRKNGNSSD
ncbi:MAG: PAC2 family protein [Nitrospinota bacterium]